MGSSVAGFIALASFGLAPMHPHPQPLCFFSTMGSSFFLAIFLTSFHRVVIQRFANPAEPQNPSAVDTHPPAISCTTRAKLALPSPTPPSDPEMINPGISASLRKQLAFPGKNPFRSHSEARGTSRSLAICPASARMSCCRPVGPLFFSLSVVHSLKKRGYLI